MKNLLLSLLLLLTIKGYSQQNCGISSTIQAHLLGTLPPNVLPVSAYIDYIFSYQFSSGPGNRIVEVTFGAGFNVIQPTIPYTNVGNTYRFDFSNSTTAGLETFTVAGSIDCSRCAGSSLPVSMRVIQNDIELCSSNISNPIWNQSLPWITQSLRSNTSTNILRGSVVRYHVTVGNNNFCFRVANSGRMLQIIDQIPAGAVFQQAFFLNPNSSVPTNLTTRNIGPNQVGIELTPLISNEFFVDILYPCNFSGTTASNRLSYLDQTNVPCAFSNTVTSNDVTINVVQSLPNASRNPGSLNKTLGAPNFTPDFNPGGTVAFEINFTNTGNFPLTTIEINDLLPPNFTGTHIAARGTATASTQVGNPFTLSALLNNQWQSITSAAYPNSPNARGFRLTVNPGHTLMPNESVRFWIYGTTNPTLYNNTVLNTANVTFRQLEPNCSGGVTGGGGTPGGGQVFSAADTDSFTTAKNTPRIVVAKLVCERPCYSVGDEIQFQLHVINEGNAPLDANGITITDMLPANLTLIGGSERYYLFPHSMATGHPGFINCDTNTSFNNREVINPPFIVSNNANGATRLNWQILAGQLSPNPNRPSPIPPGYTLHSDRIVITFICRVNNTMMPNNRGHNNQVTTNRDSIVNNINTVHAGYFMCSRDELTAEKLVSTDGGVFTTQVNAQPGATVRYQIRLTNTGNMPLTQIRIADDMPHVGDNSLGFINGQQCVPRNSQFEINASHNSTLSSGTISYFTQHNPCVSALFNYQSGNTVACCGTNSPTTPNQNPSTQGFYIDLGGFVLQPGDVWTYEFDGVLPQRLNNGLTSCNSFSFRAMRANSNVVLEFGESNTACVTIINEVAPTGCELCKDITVTPINGRLTRQQTRNGVAYQLLQNSINIVAPNTRFNQIRVNVISYQLESNYDECLIADKFAFNNVGISGTEFQQATPIIFVNGQATAPHNNTQHLNLNTSEINWQAPRTFDFANAANLPIQLFLPDFSKLECCKVSATICLRITFINDQCEVCERIVCFNTNIIDAEEVKCDCTNKGDFEVKYEVKRKVSPKKYPTTIPCNGEVKLPAGVPVMMSNPNACSGDKNCKPRYSWKLALASSQSTISSGNGSSINYTLPTVGETYILYVETFCGNNTCKNTCKISLKAVKP